MFPDCLFFVFSFSQNSPGTRLAQNYMFMCPGGMVWVGRLLPWEYPGGIPPCPMGIIPGGGWPGGGGYMGVWPTICCCCCCILRACCAWIICSCCIRSNCLFLSSLPMSIGRPGRAPPPPLSMGLCMPYGVGCPPHIPL